MEPNELPFRQLCGGLSVLLEACDWARGSGIDPWQFAVRIERLRESGFSETHLSWLLCSGNLEHAREFTPPSDDQRSFRNVGRLNFGKRSCFVLSETGIAWARTICGAVHEACPLSADLPAAPARGAAAILVTAHDAIPSPHWERDRRRLTLNSDLLMELSMRAQNLLRILDVFQEENWPQQIDDPLPTIGGVDSKRRLRSAIAKLNENVRVPRIRFCGDGSGESICWKLTTRNSRVIR